MSNAKTPSREAPVVFVDDTPGGVGGIPPADHAESQAAGPLEPATRCSFSASKNLPRRYGPAGGIPPTPPSSPRGRIHNSTTPTLCSRCRRCAMWRAGVGERAIPGPLSSACSRSHRRNYRGGPETPPTRATQGGPGMARSPTPARETTKTQRRHPKRFEEFEGIDRRRKGKGRGWGACPPWTPIFCVRSKPQTKISWRARDSADERDSGWSRECTPPTPARETTSRHLT